MTNQFYGARLPRGNKYQGQSERGLLTTLTDNRSLASGMTKIRRQSAIQAPRAGQPLWPAAGARSEHGFSSSWQDSKLNKGVFVTKKLTDKAWIRQGLKPQKVDTSRGAQWNTHTYKEHANNEDTLPLPAPAGTPPPTPIREATLEREHKKIIFFPNH